MRILTLAGALASNSKLSRADDGDEGGDDGGDDKSGGSGSGGPGTPGTSGPISQSTNGSGAKKVSKGRVLTQQEVQKLIASGQANSLPLVLAFVANNYPGQVLDVKLRALDGSFAYEVKVLSKSIFLKTVLLDAKTLKKM